MGSEDPESPGSGIGPGNGNGKVKVEPGPLVSVCGTNEDDPPPELDPMFEMVLAMPATLPANELTLLAKSFRPARISPMGMTDS
jgi:hypothetical protein